MLSVRCVIWCCVGSEFPHLTARDPRCSHQEDTVSLGAVAEPQTVLYHSLVLYSILPPKKDIADVWSEWGKNLGQGT